MRFLEIIGGWINRYFSNEEAIYLVVFLLGLFTVLFTLGDVLAPVLTGLVLAFLLQGLVKRFRALSVPEAPAVYLTFVLFVGAMIALVVFLVPLLWRQFRALIEALPRFLDRLQVLANDLVLRFPDLLTDAQVDSWLSDLSGQVAEYGAGALEVAVAQASSVVALLIYFVLVPISVFFFLKDRRELLAWFESLLPKHRPLLNRVGDEMVMQLGNYVRGKFVEILIVGSVTFVTFTFLGLNYAALLGAVVGLSVLIPFVGAAVVTIPVALVALVQFGWTWDFGVVIVAYLVIQALDGNVLVPLLFSEVVDLHPITIIIAVLAFGGLWGIWGVFFAIPLATLVKAVYNAWPGHGVVESGPVGGADREQTSPGGVETAQESSDAEPANL